MKSENRLSQITSQIIHATVHIAENIGRLEGAHLGQPDPLLMRKNRIRTIQASLAMDGNSLTRDQVTILLEKQRVNGPSREIAEVQNALAIYSRLIELNPLSMDAFLRAHRLMMKNMLTDPGLFRRGPASVLNDNRIAHAPPRWEMVASMMRELFEYLRESRDHPLIKANFFLFKLEQIHPFSGGNGRMGRVWQTRILMLYHPIFECLPVAPFILKHRLAYHRILAKGDAADGCAEFVAFMLKQVEAALLSMVDAIRGVTMTAEKRLAISRRVLAEIAFSRKDYQSALKTISTATASRDLCQGVKMGLLIRSGDKRTAVYRFK